MKKFLQVGDVFRSDALEVCHYDIKEGKLDKNRLFVGMGTSVLVWGRKKKTVRTYATDRSRSEREFVVFRAESEGGSTGGGMNGHDDYPDGWHIMARELNADGTYNPDGVVVDFYHSGCFDSRIEPKDIVKTGAMRLWFVRDSVKP